MNNTTQLEEALALALKLAPKERLQLIERVASSVEREIEPVPSGEKSADEHWGKNLLRLLDELGPIDMIHPEIDDATEWVKQIRQEQGVHRDLDWGEDE